MDALAVEGAAPLGALERADRRIHVARREEHVAPRLDGLDGGLERVGARGEARRGGRVAHQEPLELELLAERPLEDLARARGRDAARVERRIGDVRRHDRRHAGVDRPAKGHDVALHELRARRRHHRQLEMRVGGRAAVSREVLRRGEHPFRLTGVDPLGGELGDFHRL